VTLLALAVLGCSGAGTMPRPGDATLDAPASDAAGGAPGDAASDASFDAITDAPGDAGEAWSCDPNAAPLPNEGLVEPPGLGGCPPGMAPVDTFCVDRWEASLELVTPTGGATTWSPYKNPDSTPVRAVSIGGAVPQAYIDADQAEAACEASGKRLCSDDEWLRACQGPNDYTYPYGDTREPGVCNDGRAESPVIQLFGTTDAWIWTQLDNACIDQLPDSLDPAGSNPGCVTSEGLYDMMGNLHEWTSDPNGTFRGGYYVDTTLNGNGCLYVTTAHDRVYWDYSTGFRCCAG
jgi:Sulfatase-modifying factor enzyme 1